MYPQTYFGLFPAFPRKPRAFVAMSFSDEFAPRWEQVLAPALRQLSHGRDQVEPFRVDMSVASDAILTEILEAISDSLLVVADISSIGQLHDKPVRNANVMYEVGLAHAVRLPEEVVLFRSDDDHLDFDIAGVRVHRYSPDRDPEKARSVVRKTVVDSMAALDARKRASVRLLAQQLTPPAIWVLFELIQADSIVHPSTRTVGEAIAAVGRSSAIALLLRLGAISSDLITVTPELLRSPPDEQQKPLSTYSLTPLGRALFHYIADELGAFHPDLIAHIQALGEVDDDGDATV